jgi:hypothetical protein
LLAPEGGVYEKFSSRNCCLQIDDKGKVIEEITDKMRKLAHVSIQTWRGWDPSDLFGRWFCLRWIQKSDRGNGPNPRSMLNIAPSGSPGVMVYKTIMETIIERKTASHVMMLWKYKPLDQDDALLPWVGPRIKGGNKVTRRGCRKRNRQAVF